MVLVVWHGGLFACAQHSTHAGAACLFDAMCLFRILLMSGVIEALGSCNNAAAVGGITAVSTVDDAAFQNPVRQ